ncbi:MAG: hypothetical protein D4R46_00715 [Chloroflexi bacterium]|nr:MAG: hypothetical protein D4R46_00715 [Chloroflexota bacterium]
MFWKKFIAISASVFLMLVSACNMPGGPAVVSGTNQDPTAAIETRVAEIVASTAAAQTALANAVASTLTAMPTNTPEFTFTPSLTPTPTFTLTSTPMFTLTPSLTPTPTFTLTSTPTFTLTPSLTPTPTFTLTPEVPMVSVSVQTNCRSGPGPAYDILGIMNVGQTAEVVGRSVNNENWIIKLPSNPAITCWLWGQYATVVGNTAGLPIVTPPPTPTPAASFNVIYSSTTPCGVLYGIKFQITNNGSVTWESDRVITTDQATSETVTVDRNNFPNFNGCAAASTDQNLEAGEVGITTNAGFSANPAGHSITATIRVCSLDGMAGTCLEKTITFTP